MRPNANAVFKDLQGAASQHGSPRKLAASSESLTSNSRVLQFPNKSKPPSPQGPNNAPVKAGPRNRPAAYVLNAKSDLVIRASRETRDVIAVARRLGVRANDVFEVVLKRLEEAEKKAA